LNEATQKEKNTKTVETLTHGEEFRKNIPTGYGDGGYGNVGD